MYCSDMFTAANLLANSNETSFIPRTGVDLEVFGKLPFEVYKWLFSGCILLGFLLLGLEIRRARAIIKSRDISHAFTSLIASRFYTVRSYPHYCFFAQIDNSKKLVDNVAFFCFFTFRSKCFDVLLLIEGMSVGQLRGERWMDQPLLISSTHSLIYILTFAFTTHTFSSLPLSLYYRIDWKRLMLADAPRQVINATILYQTFRGYKLGFGAGSIFDWNLVFGDNLLKKITVGAMIFTVFMFAFSLVLLVVAVIMYLPLVCHIQGNLKEFCCHKIDKR